MGALKKHTAASSAARSAEIRAEEARNYSALYGRHLPAKEFLYSRGFVVTRDGAGVMVDNKRMTFAEMEALAERERRLAENAPTVRAVSTTASGLSIGAVVPLKPKAPIAASPPLSTVKQKELAGAAAKAKQKAEETSADLGPQPRLEWLELGELTVDHRYQRAMGKDNWRHANRILREWNWLHYQPIVVAPAAAGGYTVIDGQHRLEAARKHPLIDRLPCYIVDASDVAHQAAAFVALNGRRIGVTRLQRFWAAHAGGDKTALRIHKICTDAGVAITRSGGRLPPMTTFSTFTIEKLLPIGADNLTKALAAIGEAFPETEDAFKSPLIFAMAQMVKSLPDRTMPRLVKILRAQPIDELLGAARVRRGKEGGSVERALEATLRARLMSA